jgi:threonine dehydrogenase-like Zn-dependent dehydrogenase
MALKLAAYGGRVCCVGLMEAPYPIAFHPEFISRELTLIAAHQPHCPIADNIYWHWTQQENRKLVLEMLADHRLRVSEMITHRFPVAQAPQAYELLKTGDPGMLGAMLLWS